MPEHEVKWDRVGREPIGDYTAFGGNGNKNYEVQPGFSVYKRIISAVITAQFPSERMSQV
jgi:hypothetical protein